MNYKRKQQLAVLIRENLGTIIQRDIAGQLPGLATITHVDLSDDLKYAKIRVSLFGKEDAKRKSFGLLCREIKNLRQQLSKTLSIRNVPFLSFIEDNSLDDAFRIEELLEKIHKEEKKPESNGGESNPK